MKIVKALKLKNRLVHDLNVCRERIKRDNSALSKKHKGADHVVNLAVLENATLENLVELKTAIQVATAPIASLLIEMAEKKSKLKFLGTIPTRKGEEDVHDYQGKLLRVDEYITTFDEEEIIQKSADLEEQINHLQDKIDEYNASTDIGKLSFE